MFLKDDPRVIDFFMEEEGYEPEKGEWSYWIYFKNWIDRDNGIHAIHEPTAKDVLERLKWFEPCTGKCCKE